MNDKMIDVGKLIEESAKSKDRKALKSMWNNMAIRTIIPKRWDSWSITDEQFYLIRDAFKGMREATDWKTYKPYFDTIVKTLHIPPEQCIIRKYRLKKGKTDKNYVSIEYANARTRITIPAGCKLYHKSPIKGLTELVPQFKGRSAKGHLYNNHRLYFSIHKDMGKSHADIVKSDTAHTYEVIENIKTAYIDPLVPFHMTGAVYIDTTKPIKVKSLDLIRKENAKQIAKESVMNESENNDTKTLTLAEKMRSLDNFLAVRKEWNKLANQLDHEEKTKFITEDECEVLKEHLDIMKSDKDYQKYKKSFDTVCGFFDLSPNDTLIETLEIKNDKVYIRYSKGRQRITIPAGTTLLYVAPVDNIDELKPSFKSKVDGKYMYSSKRVFFTIGKMIPSNKAGLENTKTYKYTPIENISTAYIDQACSDYNTGAVYVDSPYPIKVKKLGE